MTGMIREATPDDAAAVTALRRAEYSTSREFTLLSPDALAWGPADHLGLVLVAAARDGQIVSTMRGRVFASRAVFERSSGLDLAGGGPPRPDLVPGPGLEG